MTTEQTLKRELLLAFHILDLAGQNSGIAGHLTARRPGGADEAVRLQSDYYERGFGEPTWRRVSGGEA